MVKLPTRKELKRAVVAGAGISGLTAAFQLHERAQNTELDLRLLEAGNRPGGVIRSFKSGENLLEAGPDSILLQKPAAMTLCRRLGLGDEIVYPSKSGSICILKNGQISPIPEGFKMVAPTRLWPMVRSPLFSLRGKARMAGDLFKGGTRTSGDESLGSFVRRRLGNEVLELVVQPMLASIFLADADRMSLRLVMPRLAALEEKFGSVIRGLRAQLKLIPPEKKHAAEQSFFSLREGVSQLVDSLATALPEGTLSTNTAIQGIERLSEDRWKLHLPEGQSAEADALLLALPFHASSRLLADISPELSRELATTNYASCATINFVYDRKHIDHTFIGNGFFVPRDENLSFMACNFVQEKFPDRIESDKVVLRVFVGGTLQGHLLKQSDDQLVTRCNDELARLFNIHRAPREALVTRYTEAMPQFEVGYGDKLVRIRALLAKLPGLYLTGSGMGVIGIPDCIQCGQESADMAFDYLRHGDGSLLVKTG